MASWHVVQVGARDGYFWPNAVHRNGQLGHLYTDYLSGTRRITRHLDKRLSIRSSKNVRLPRSRSHDSLSVAVSGIASRTKAGRALELPWPSRSFSPWAQSQVQRNSQPGDRLIAYSRATSGLFDPSYDRHELVRILVHPDPGPALQQKVKIERERYPWLAELSPKLPLKSWEKWQREVDAAQLVIVNSDWYKKEVFDNSVDVRTIKIPLPLTPPVVQNPIHTAYNGPLRVLIAGQVSLAKGFGRVLEVASSRAAKSMTFTVVGSDLVGLSKVKTPENLTYIGRKTRDALFREYQTHDVLLFPTLGDGFGFVQYEALAAGLPVVASPFSASAVDDGRTGMILESVEPDCILEALLALQDETFRLVEMRDRLRSVDIAGDLFASAHQSADQLIASL